MISKIIISQWMRLAFANPIPIAPIRIQENLSSKQRPCPTKRKFPEICRPAKTQSRASVNFQSEV
jgi:hypothetical protein